MLIEATDIIAKTWQLYKTNFRQLVPYILLFIIPFLLTGIFAGTGVFLELHVPLSSTVNGIIFWVVILLNVFMFAWVYTAFIKALGSLVNSGTMPLWRESLAQSLPLLWPLFYTLLLAYLIILAGYLLLIIPGIIFAIWYVFVPYSVIFNNEKGLNGLRASKQLVKGRWWDILWRVFLPSLFFGIIIGLAEFLLSLPAEYISNKPMADLVLSLVSLIINAVLIPLTIIAPIILYFSARENPAVSASTPVSTPSQS